MQFEPKVHQIRIVLES